MRGPCAIFWLIWMLPASLFAQVSRDYKSEAIQLRTFLSSHHVEPRQINDSLSNDIFNKTIEDLDPDKTIFTLQDIDFLNVFRNSIDEELYGKNWSFLGRLTERYLSNLKRTDFFIKSIVKTELRYDVNETFDAEPKIWMKNEAALQGRIQRMLKYEALQKISWFMERDSVYDADAIKRYGFDALNHVRAIELRNIDHVINNPAGFDNYVADVFLRSITGVYDPHTVYLSSSDFESFKGALNSEDFYFGFKIDDNDDGEVVILALTPGGPAWKSGEIQVGDVLVAVKADGSDAVDLEGMSIDEVNALLDGLTDKVLEFTVRKTEGITKTVRLEKEKMKAEENVVHSFILEGEHKAGYIHLPDFYTRWDDAQEGAQCANDVAKEIVKLKKDGMEGLILDLRSNGGGSLYEAISMAGIFIDQGALGMMRDNTGAVTVLKDVNRGTVYDGPLIIMVNGHSASASEVMGAAIQNYNRGIIVGSQTYGKATGQTILPLNDAHDAALAVQNNESFVKVTTERIYRVTGGSIQGRGLTPDIALPDIFAALSSNEGKTPFSLKGDSVMKKSYYKALADLPREQLRRNSNDRVLNNSSFQQLTRAYQWYADMVNSQKALSLMWTSFLKAENEKRKNLELAKQNYQVLSQDFKVKNNSAEADRLRFDNYQNQYNDAWKEKLQHDIYLNETYHILRDYIDLQ
jgi:carboxyl-terminal processing protease